MKVFRKQYLSRPFDGFSLLVGILVYVKIYWTLPHLVVDPDIKVIDIEIGIPVKVLW